MCLSISAVFQIRLYVGCLALMCSQRVFVHAYVCSVGSMPHVSTSECPHTTTMIVVTLVSFLPFLPFVFLLAHPLPARAGLYGRAPGDMHKGVRDDTAG